MSDQAREHAASLRMARHILANCECRYASQAWESYKELDALADALAAERAAREQAEQAADKRDDVLREVADISTGWSVTGVPVEDLRRINVLVLAALAASGGTGQ